MYRKSIRLELECQNLLKNEYFPTSPQTKKYNCIAWAAGEQERPWWPVPYPHQPPYYWPCKADDESLEVFIQCFNLLGYEECDSDDLEQEFEKVAIFTEDEEVTHMARQLPSGLWASKCGDLEDIEHSLKTLEGSSFEKHGYGTVACIMKRRLNTNLA